MALKDFVKDWGGFEKLVASLHESGTVRDSEGRARRGTDWRGWGHHDRSMSSSRTGAAFIRIAS